MLCLVLERWRASNAGQDVEDLAVPGWGDLAEEEVFVHGDGLQGIVSTGRLRTDGSPMAMMRLSAG